MTQSGIRAIVSHGPKREDRLAKKLDERKRRKRYKELQEIFEDIPDLAGVRIALYFPDDKREVERLITSSFVVEKPKVFPEADVVRNLDRRTGFTLAGTEHRIIMFD